MLPTICIICIIFISLLHVCTLPELAGDLGEITPLYHNFLNNPIDSNFVFADDDAKYQELVEYALISLGYPFVSLTPQETALMIGIKAYKMQHPGKSLLPNLNAMQLRLDSMEKRYDKFKSNEDSFNLTQFIVDNSARYERTRWY